LLFKNNPNLKLDEITMYDKKCGEITSRDPLNLGTHLVSGEKQELEGALNFESTEEAEVAKADKAIKEYMAKNNVSYEVAHDILSKQNS